MSPAERVKGVIQTKESISLTVSLLPLGKLDPLPFDGHLSDIPDLQNQRYQRL